GTVRPMRLDQILLEALIEFVRFIIQQLYRFGESLHEELDLMRSAAAGIDADSELAEPIRVDKVLEGHAGAQGFRHSYEEGHSITPVKADPQCMPSWLRCKDRPRESSILAIASSGAQDLP